MKGYPVCYSDSVHERQDRIDDHNDQPGIQKRVFLSVSLLCNIVPVFTVGTLVGPPGKQDPAAVLPCFPDQSHQQDGKSDDGKTVEKFQTERFDDEAVYNGNCGCGADDEPCCFGQHHFFDFFYHVHYSNTKQMIFHYKSGGV